MEIQKRFSYTVEKDGVVITKYNLEESYVEIPEMIEEKPVIAIAESAFAWNPKVCELKIPDTVKECGQCSFACMDMLKAVTLPAQLKDIPKGMFDHCTNLRKVWWPASLEKIGENAFCSTDLERIDFPETVVELGNRAFANIKLKKVTLPKTVQKIGIRIFEGVKEIQVFDTLEPFNKSVVKDSVYCNNGRPNSNIGWIGNDYYCVYDTVCGIYRLSRGDWYDYTITVLSAETSKVKYKVWMSGSNEPRTYSCKLCAAWGGHAEFNFSNIDSEFDNMRDLADKVRYSLYRLQYPYNLSDTDKNKFLQFIKKMAVRIVRRCIDDKDLELLKYCEPYEVLTKNNIDKLIAYAEEKKSKRIATYLKKWKNGKIV